MSNTLKVLIADDEEMERKAIREILRVCRGNAVVILEAVNGRDAVKKAAEERPDMIMMDIQMPVLDGLAALEEIHTFLPQVFAVILTAYDEFDYAVKALKLGVEDYILKPVRKQKLQECFAAFDGKRQQCLQVASANLTPALEGLFPYLEDNFISHIVMNELANGYAQQLAQYLFPEADPLSMAVGQDIQKRDCVEGLHRVLSQLELKGVVSVMGDQVLLVIQYPLQAEQTWWEILQEPLSEVCRQWQVGKPVWSAEQLAEEYRGLTKQGEEVQREVPSYTARPSVEKEIAVKLATSDEQGALGLFEEIFVSKQWDLSNEAVPFQQKLMSICAVVDHYLAKMLGDRIQEAPPDFRNLTSRQELAQAVRAFVVSRAHICRAIQQPKITKVIRDIINDMESNYQNGMYSLNAAADHLGLSPAYLSKIFPQKMGKTFTEYLSEIRIDEAKRLLRESERDIMEIAKICGFNSANYFCRVFKKLTGISPSDYRISAPYNPKKSYMKK